MIENIVFDIGNVLVRWDPRVIVSEFFPYAPNPTALARQLFKEKIWFDLNLGKITEQEALDAYRDTLNLNTADLDKLMPFVKSTLVPLSGSHELVTRLSRAGYALYSITDNTKGILHYLTETYTVFQHFKGIVVSAELGVLKPAEKIFLHLLTTYGLDPSKTVFFDDIQDNVEGAKRVGMEAFQFTTAVECEMLLKERWGICV